MESFGWLVFFPVAGPARAALSWTCLVAWPHAATIQIQTSSRTMLSRCADLLPTMAAVFSVCSRPYVRSMLRAILLAFAPHLLLECGPRIDCRRVPTAGIESIVESAARRLHRLDAQHYRSINRRAPNRFVLRAPSRALASPLAGLRLTLLLGAHTHTHVIGSRTADGGLNSNNDSGISDRSAIHPRHEHR